MASDKPRFNPALVANFTRLLNDASYLQHAGRYESAFALGVIGLEEIAKQILAFWADMSPDIPIARRRNQHLTKQAAIACLLVAESIVPSFDAIVAGDDHDRAWLSDRKFRVDEAFMWKAHDNELQKAKHLALYYDVSQDSGQLDRPDFTAEQVNELIAHARRAVMLTASREAMIIAFCLFQVLKDSPIEDRPPR